MRGIVNYVTMPRIYSGADPDFSRDGHALRPTNKRVATGHLYNNRFATTPGFQKSVVIESNSVRGFPSVRYAPVVEAQ